MDASRPDGQEAMSDIVRAMLLGRLKQSSLLVKQAKSFAKWLLSQKIWTTPEFQSSYGLDLSLHCKSMKICNSASQREVI